MFTLELFVAASMMLVGARYGGIFFGMAGGLGLVILIFVFGIKPASPPIDVILIMLAVVVTASTLQTAGGMQFLVRLAEHLLRRNPKQITIIAPFVAYIFTFISGTGNILYNILPVIAEVSRETGVRPERPISASVIASQQAITSCPISAATVAMIALLSPHGITVANILMITLPATLLGTFAGSLVVSRLGKELHNDPLYLAKTDKELSSQNNVLPLINSTIEPGSAKLSVTLFLSVSVILVVMGAFPNLRPKFILDGKTIPLSMTDAIEILMLAAAALMVIFCKVDVGSITSGSVFKAGVMGIVSVFGLAWMSDTIIQGNIKLITSSITYFVQDYPWTFALALFGVSALTHSQAATVASIMPLGISLQIPDLVLIAMFPAVCGYFLIPSTGVLLAGVAFDSTGTTKIGKYVINHSYMIPGLVSTSVSVGVGLLLTQII